MARVRYAKMSPANINRSAPAATEAAPTAKGTAAAPIVIEIPSSPDHSEGTGKGRSTKKARKKRSAPPPDLDDEVEMWTPREKLRIDEDCLILAGDPLAAADKVPAAAPGSDDIQIVAERGKVACRDYPHPRSACVKNPFNTTPHERHCDKCFCYVCDVAAPCVSWKGTGGHCHAWEKDQKWKAMRYLMRKEKNRT